MNPQASTRPRDRGNLNERQCCSRAPPATRPAPRPISIRRFGCLAGSTSCPASGSFLDWKGLFGRLCGRYGPRVAGVGVRASILQLCSPRPWPWDRGTAAGAGAANPGWPTPGRPIDPDPNIAYWNDPPLTPACWSDPPQKDACPGIPTRTAGTAAARARARPARCRPGRAAPSASVNERATACVSSLGATIIQSLRAAVVQLCLERRRVQLDGEYYPFRQYALALPERALLIVCYRPRAPAASAPARPSPVRLPGPRRRGRRRCPCRPRSRRPRRRAADRPTRSAAATAGRRACSPASLRVLSGSASPPLRSPPAGPPRRPPRRPTCRPTAHRP